MNNFSIPNVDTDSISFCKPDMSPFSTEEQANLLTSLNSLYPEKIKWEHDGIFDVFVVVAAKNYIKLHDGEIEIKGGSMKAPMKEPALKQFIDEIIHCLVYDKVGDCLSIYNKYVREIHNIQDMGRWCSKKTVTDSVLNPKRSTEQKILDAIGSRKVQMGDKIFVYFRKDETLGLRENWANDHDPAALLKKLHNTILVFANVLDVTQFTNYALKSHAVKVKLHEILGLPAPELVKKTRKKNNLELNN